MPRRPERECASSTGGGAQRSARFVAGCAAVATLLTSCEAKSPNLVVEAPRSMNGGRPVYMLVRAVEEAKFSVDSYQTVAAKVSVPDDSVLLTEVIYPGTRPAFPVTPPAKGQLAVYFLFGNPTGDWRILLDKSLPKTVAIKLGKDQIDVR